MNQLKSIPNNLMLPDLVEIQRSSFKSFLNEGLSEVLDSFPPILDPTNRLELTLYGKDYQIKFPKYSVRKAKKRDRTYSVQIYVPAKLTRKDLELSASNQDIIDIKKINRRYKKRSVFIGDLPVMTNRGAFIVSGTNRVVVNQIVRSPGIYYKEEIDKKGNSIYYANLISNRGSWLKLEIDSKGHTWARIDKAHKINIYVFLRAVGLTDEDLKTSLMSYPFLIKSSKQYEEKELAKEIGKEKIQDISNEEACAICS